MIIKAQVEIEIPDQDAIRWLEGKDRNITVADEMEGAEFRITLSGMTCAFRVSDAEKDQ